MEIGASRQRTKIGAKNCTDCCGALQKGTLWCQKAQIGAKGTDWCKRAHKSAQKGGNWCHKPQSGAEEHTLESNGTDRCQRAHICAGEHRQSKVHR